MRALLVALVVLAAACADETAPSSTTLAPPTTTTTTVATTVPPASFESTEVLVGGDRPARLVLPPGWEPGGEARALVVLLHGYTASGELQDLYLGVSATGADFGYLTLTPDGTTDPLGNRFWNVTDLRAPVDDAAYLVGLIDEVIAAYNVDADRVFLVGHSNGGFMANKLACEMADRIAGIAAIAGGIIGPGAGCDQPMRVLVIQGTDDSTVPYDGGEFFGSRILGAEDTATLWREAGVCSAEPKAEGPFDFDLLVPGTETTIEVWDDCAPEARVELWTMEGSGHIPGVFLEFRRTLMERLLGAGPEVG